MEIVQGAAGGGGGGGSSSSSRRRSGALFAFGADGVESGVV